MVFALPALLGLGLAAFLFGFDFGSDDDTNDIDGAVDPVDSPDPVATDGPDTVTFGNASDIFDGLGGNDVLSGGKGFDTLNGGAGDDILNGDGGKDVLSGDGGNDTLSGGDWNDILNGGTGFDDLAGDAGNDTLNGDGGKDLLEGGTGNDTLNGGDWNDGLFGGDGDDFLNGDAGNDMLVGGLGDDQMFGGTGDDIVLGGAGADFVNGGDGDDVVAGSNIFTRELTPEEFDAIRDGTAPVDEDGAVIFEGWDLQTDADMTADNVNGGAGDDIVFVGNNDIVSGGTGFDDFYVGDWITSGTPSTITDFSSQEGDVIVVGISADNSDATVGVEEEDGNTFITIDGVRVANVQGSFDTLDGLESDIFTVIYGD